MSDSKHEEILEKIEEMFPDQLLLSIKDLSAVMGLSAKTIYNYTAPKSKKDFLKPVRHSRLLKFRIHDVAKYLAAF